MEKKLYRDETRKVIGGVCAGLAEYFGVDISIVRLLFLLTLILKGGGMLIYIILWIVLPKKSYQINQPPFVDYTVPPTAPPQADPQLFNQPQKRSTASIIAGAVLVLLGMYFILDDFNIIPNWDFDHFWPVILIAVGIVFVFSGNKKQPWEKDNWHQNDNPSNDNLSKDNSSNDNSTTI